MTHTENITLRENAFRLLQKITQATLKGVLDVTHTPRLPHQMSNNDGETLEDIYCDINGSDPTGLLLCELHDEILEQSKSLEEKIEKLDSLMTTIEDNQIEWE
tara:strand:- start:122 stop:430 length:309 start_codon:yes stop_codon:yes gene_type:complete